MAHKLANGDYRHKDFLIRQRSVPCSTGIMYEYKVVVLKKTYYTLREAVAAINDLIEFGA